MLLLLLLLFLLLLLITLLPLGDLSIIDLLIEIGSLLKGRAEFLLYNSYFYLDIPCVG